jgi:hypothetical protein
MTPADKVTAKGDLEVCGESLFKQCAKFWDNADFSKDVSVNGCTNLKGDVTASGKDNHSLSYHSLESCEVVRRRTRHAAARFLPNFQPYCSFKTCVVDSGAFFARGKSVHISASVGKTVSL